MNVYETVIRVTIAYLKDCMVQYKLICCDLSIRYDDNSPLTTVDHQNNYLHTHKTLID